jgi:hypothetical protein
MKRDTYDERGIEAIIFMQKKVGKHEPLERAQNGWEKMTPFERERTMRAFEALGGLGEAQRCTIYETSCSDHGFAHGAEASELREGIEQIIKDHCGDDGTNESGAAEEVCDELQLLLEKVDARDSVARLEIQVGDTSWSTEPLPCITCGRVHVKGKWWPRHPYKTKKRVKRSA